MKERRIIVGITHGDINGISYEVILKTLRDDRISEFCTPLVYGSPKIWGFYRTQLEIENINFNLLGNASDVKQQRVNFINVMGDNPHADVGRSTPAAGEGSLKALQTAVRDLKDGKIDVVVTAPINKHNIEIPGKKFVGHTEFLAEAFGAEESLMLMISDQLKIGVVTGHIPLHDVPKAVTKEKILKKLDILNKSLKRDFMIVKPKIAVLGLNPHSSDNGLIGNEEADTIIPAIAEAQDKDILAFGPFPADGFLCSETSCNKFDAVLAMYHDQGMIAFKSKAFDSGVNFTAGLSIVRTSPAHGTAYEIAGRNEANPNSFRAALYAACDIYKNRKIYDSMNANPLKVENSLAHKRYDSRADKTIVLTDD